MSILTQTAAPIAPDLITSATLTEYFVFDPETVFSDSGLSFTTPATSGGSVGSVKAKAGRAETLVQTTSANQPTWSVEPLSGKSGLVLNGTSQGIIRSYTGTVGTYVLVYKTNAAGNSVARNPQCLARTQDSSGAIVSGLFQFYTDTANNLDVAQFRMARSDGSLQIVETGPVFGDLDVILARTDGTTAEIDRDGKLCSQQVVGTGTASGIGSLAVLGASGTTTAGTLSSWLRGNIVAFVTYSGRVSDAEMPGLMEWAKRIANKPAALGRYMGLYFYGNVTGIGSTIGAASQSAAMVRSDDLINWTRVPIGTFPDAANKYLKRDYGVAYEATSGAIFVTCTQGPGPFIPIFKMSDKFTPVYQQTIDCTSLAGAGSSLWAAEFVKKQDGSIWLDGSSLPRMVFSWNTSASTAAYKPSIMKPTDTTWTTGGSWAAASLIPFATVPADAIDLSMIVDTGGTAHLFYAIRNSGFTTSVINYATSPTGPDGTFTIQGTPGSDNFGFGTAVEGPQPIYRAADGKWFMHIDREGNGYSYAVSSGGPGGTYSASRLINCSFIPEHGNMIPTPPGM